MAAKTDTGIQFEALFRKHDAIMLLLDGESGRIVDANDAALRFYGYALPQIKTMNISDINQLPSQKLTEDRKKAANDQQQYFLRPHRLANGVTRTVEVHTSTISSGGVTYLFSVIHDITPRKQAEEALQENESRFRAFFENASAGYFFIDADGIIRDVNSTWVRLYKYDSKEEIIGKHFSIIQQLEDQKLADDVVHSIMRGDPLYQTGEFSRKCKDGSLGWHSFSARSVLRTGKPIGIEGVIIDVTERKLADAAVLESEHKFRSLFESMAEGVALHEMTYADNGKAVDYMIIDTNPAFERNTGISIESVRGRLATEVYKTPDAPYLDVYERVISTGKPDSFETYFPPMNKWFSISVYSPGPRQFATVFTDITSRKLSEQLLRESEEKFKNLFNNAGIGMFRTKLDGSMFLDLNDKYLSMLGTTREETIGKPSGDLWADPVERAAMVKALRATGRVDNLECKIRKKTAPS
jgi:PAS domain S-box-containing protein